MSSGVWMVTTFPLWERNGYAANVAATLKALAPAGALSGVVAVISARDAGSGAARAWRDSFAYEYGLALEIVVAPPDLGLSALRWLSDTVTRMRVGAALRRRGASMVHARGIRAGYLVSGTRCAFLLDVRGDTVAEAEQAAETHPSPRARRLVEWSRRETVVAIRDAAAFAAVSGMMKRWLAEHGSGSRPCDVIPCPVAVEEFETSPGTASDTLTVAYLGGLQPYQPATLVAGTLVALVRSSPLPARAWVITGAEAETLEQIFAEAEIEYRIESLDHHEVARRLCEADIGVAPRFVDPVSAVSCPTKIGEYLAAGVPVLASEGVGEWPAYLASHGVGAAIAAGPSVEVPADVQEFVRSVAAARGEFRSACRELAERDWSWNTARPRLLALYDSVLGARS